MKTSVVSVCMRADDYSNRKELIIKMKLMMNNTGAKTVYLINDRSATVAEMSIVDGVQTTTWSI